MKKQSTSRKKLKHLRRKRPTWTKYDSPKMVIHKGQIGYVPQVHGVPLAPTPEDLSERTQIKLPGGLVLVGKKKKPVEGEAVK